MTSVKPCVSMTLTPATRRSICRRMGRIYCIDDDTCLQAGHDPLALNPQPPIFFGGCVPCVIIGRSNSRPPMDTSLGPPPPDRRVVWSLRGGHPGGLRVLWGPEGLALRGPWLRHGRAPPPPPPNLIPLSPPSTQPSPLSTHFCIVCGFFYFSNKGLN